MQVGWSRVEISNRLTRFCDHRGNDHSTQLTPVPNGAREVSDLDLETLYRLFVVPGHPWVSDLLAVGSRS